MTRRKSSRYCALNPISRSGPLYSLGTLSSLSPVSTDEEKTFTSPWREAHANGARALVGKLRHALDSGADFVLLQFRDLRRVFRKHALVIREVAGQFAGDQQARRQPGKRDDCRRPKIRALPSSPDSSASLVNFTHRLFRNQRAELPLRVAAVGGARPLHTPAGGRRSRPW